MFRLARTHAHARTHGKNNASKTRPHMCQALSPGSSGHFQPLDNFYIFCSLNSEIAKCLQVL